MLNDFSMRCIFDGTKFFWRSRTNLDVCIIEHGEVGVYEIIFYEPSCDVEARRVYIDQKLLRAKLDDEDIDSKLSFAKRNNVPLTEKFVASVVDKSITDYLLNRIKINQHIPEEKVLDVDIKFSDLDSLTGTTESIFLLKPINLIPYRTKHHKLLLSEVVEETLTALNRDTGALHESCEMAAALCDLNDKPLTAKERWRMPLVIAKVDRGQRLNVGDTRIFGRLQSNMKTNQDLTAMKVVMNSKTTGSMISSLTVVTSACPSTTTSPRSSMVSPSPSRSRLHSDGKSPTTSHLLSDTACSRNKNMREEASTPRASACKSRRNKKTVGTPRHKKSAKSPKTGSTGSGSLTPKGSCSIRASSDGFEARFCENGALEEESEDSKEVNSAVAIVVAGLQAFGSSIKASFNFDSGKKKYRADQGSLVSVPATAEAVNTLTLSEQGAFAAALPDLKEHEDARMEMDAVGSLKKPVHKAVRRNSLLASFVQLFTDKAVPLNDGGGADTHHTVNVSNTESATSIGNWFHWRKTNKQVLPVE